MDQVPQSVKHLKHYLRAHRVSPTAQRLRIAEVLFAATAHFSAEEIYAAVNTDRSTVSKATVYNTLGLFVRKGLIRQVVVDPSRVFYDSNMSAHHHFYDVDTGEVEDIPIDQVAVAELPRIPAGKQIESVEVVVRVKKR